MVPKIDKLFIYNVVMINKKHPTKIIYFLEKTKITIYNQ